MASFNVNPEVAKIIKEYAQQIGVEVEEALNRLVMTADSRRKALAKYAGTGVKKAPKAEKAPKAKKAAPKGTSLAKKKAPAKKEKVAKAPKAPAIAVVSGDEQAPL